MSSISTEAEKHLKIVELTTDQVDRFLIKDMDMLYNKGKADKWPKEVMDYLMWWEHEVTRYPWRLRGLKDSFKIIRKGLSCISTTKPATETTS